MCGQLISSFETFYCIRCSWTSALMNEFDGVLWDMRVERSRCCIDCNWMTFPRCGSIYVRSQDYNVGWTFYHTSHRWTVSHLCEFFHASLDLHYLKTVWSSDYSAMVSRQCEFSQISSSTKSFRTICCIAEQTKCFVSTAGCPYVSIACSRSKIWFLTVVQAYCFSCRPTTWFFLWVFKLLFCENGSETYIARHEFFDAVLRSWTNFEHEPLLSIVSRKHCMSMVWFPSEFSDEYSKLKWNCIASHNHHNYKPSCFRFLYGTIEYVVSQPLHLWTVYDKPDNWSSFHPCAWSYDFSDVSFWVNCLWHTWQTYGLEPVCILQVKFQIRTFPKPFTAICANKWSFTSVNLLMTLRNHSMLQTICYIVSKQIVFLQITSGIILICVFKLLEALSDIARKCMVFSPELGTFAYVVSHSSHIWIVSDKPDNWSFLWPVCVIIWLFRWTCWVNGLKHTSTNIWFFSSMKSWMKFLIRVLFHRKPFPQTWANEYGLIHPSESSHDSSNHSKLQTFYYTLNKQTVFLW